MSMVKLRCFYKVIKVILISDLSMSCNKNYTDNEFRIRRGNPFTPVIQLEENGEPVNFDDYPQRSIEIRHESAFDRLTPLNISYSGDTVSFDVQTSEKDTTGTYIIYIRFGNDTTSRVWDSSEYRICLVANSVEQNIPEDSCGNIYVPVLKLKGCIQFGKDGHSPYIDTETQTWWEYDDETERYVDTGKPYKGKDGTDGRGVKSLSFDADGVGTVTYTDETSEPIGGEPLATRAYVDELVGTANTLLENRLNGV